MHGDVSPANILFTDFGLPLLADLGVARLTGDAAAARCTPAYADPTVVAGSAPGPRTDVFMVAGVALHALTGVPPWPGVTAAEALAAAARGDLDVGRQFAAAGVPSVMADVVGRALSLDPLHRGTAADFALELRHCGHPVAVELHAGRPAPEPAVPLSAQPESVGFGPRAAGRPTESAAAAEPDAARPAFDRPAFDRPAIDRPAIGGGRENAPRGLDLGSPALTRGVRARPVRLHAAPTRARRLRARRLRDAHSRLGRPWVGPVAGLLVALALCGAALAWRASTGHRPVVRAVTAGGLPASAPTTAAPVLLPAATPAESELPTPATRAPSETAQTALDVLRRLDAARAAAYAQRRPAQLGAVYADAGLRDADIAQLARSVPVGCGLVGVLTDFRDLTVAGARPSGIEVVVTATLRPSRLVCGGALSARVPGTGPRRMRIDLATVGDGYRVAGERAA